MCLNLGYFCNIEKQVFNAGDDVRATFIKYCHIKFTRAKTPRTQIIRRNLFREFVKQTLWTAGSGRRSGKNARAKVENGFGDELLYVRVRLASNYGCLYFSPALFI